MNDAYDFLSIWLRKPYAEQVWIPLPEMCLGYYVCKARNFNVGYWNGSVFEYTRYKFGTTFSDTEYHWDEGSPFGTCKPIKYLGEKI